MSKLTASVLVPTFNRGPFLGACLKSLLTQTRPAGQILVVNDGSTDDTEDILRSFGDAIEVIRTPQVGKPSALNSGLRLVRGDGVWIFDDDDVSLPDALERLLEPLEADATLAFSFSSFYYTPSRPNGRLGQPTAISRIPDLATRGPLVPLLEGNYLGGAALFARTRCYEVVGGFDQSLIRSQDYEMAIRLVRRFQGRRVRGGPTFHYRQHPGWRGQGEALFEESQRNEKWREYDQQFFRRLYRELPLAEYVAPGTWCADKPRLALLQRSAVMATKDLTEEVLAELAQLAATADQSPLSPEEGQVVRDTLLKPSWYGRGMLATPRFWTALRQLALPSPVIREIAALARRARWREARRSLVRSIYLGVTGPFTALLGTKNGARPIFSFFTLRIGRHRHSGRSRGEAKS